MGDQISSRTAKNLAYCRLLKYSVDNKQHIELLYLCERCDIFFILPSFLLHFNSSSK